MVSVTGLSLCCWKNTRMEQLTKKKDRNAIAHQLTVREEDMDRIMFIATNVCHFGKPLFLL